MLGDAVVEKDVCSIILMENLSAASGGKWFPTPRHLNSMSVSIVPVDRNNAALLPVAPSADLTVWGIDSNVEPASTVDGHEIAKLGPTASSAGGPQHSIYNSGFTYHWVKVSNPALAAPVSVMAKFVRV
jgi:hypothetical protein